MLFKVLLPLFSMALVFVAVPAVTQAIDDASHQSALDLPAMIMTPTDLGFAGMAAYPIVYVDGDLQSAQEVADEFVGAKAVPAERANEVFLETGLEWRYWHRYLLAYPSDTNEPRPPAMIARRVATSVYEFADVKSATSAFDKLSRLLGRDAPAINAGIVPIGDDSRLSRAEAPHEKSVGTYPELTLTFRSANLIASVTIADDEGEPSLAAVQALATQFLVHMTTVSSEGAPGLSSDVLRLPEFEALRGNYDGYTLIGGSVIARSSGSSDVRKTIEATAAAGAGALDGYKLSYYLVADYGAWVADFGTLVYRFHDDNQAANWIEHLPDRIRSTFAYSLEITDVPGIGENAFVAYYEETPETGLDARQLATVQVGKFVAIIYGPQMDPETTQAYLEMQGQCLDRGCYDNVSQPRNLHRLTVPS